MSQRDRCVRIFLLAQTVSSIGSWATLTALWGVAQYRFDVSAGGVTMIALGWSTPTVLIFPVVGLTIDRLGPRRVLAAAEVASVAVLLLMIASTTFSQLVVLAACSGLAKAFIEPATLALPPRLVEDDDLPRVNGSLRMTGYIGLVMGPALGGFALDRFGFDSAFAIDATSFIIGLIGLALLPHDRPGAHCPGARSVSLRADLAEGYRITRDTPILRRLVTATMALSTLYGASIVLEPLYVKHVLHRTASTFAWLQCAFGLTLVLTGIYTVRHAARLARLRVCALAAIGSAGAAAVYLGSTEIAVAFAGIGMWGVMTAFFSTPSATLIHRSAPGSAHGRVLSFERMVDAALKMAATLVTGGLAAGIGVRPTAAVIVAVSLAISIPAARGTRDTTGAAATVETVPA